MVRQIMSRKLWWSAVKTVRLGLVALSFALAGIASAASVDLSVSAYTQAPDPVAKTGTATFNVTVTSNENFTDATDTLTLAINLPSNVDFTASPTPTGCVFNLVPNPKTLTCTKSGLAALATWTVTFTGLGQTVGAVNTDATVSIGGVDSDPNPGNDSLTKTATVINGADLTIVKTGTTGLSGCPGACAATAGSTISFNLDVSNNGPDAASLFHVVDNLPASSDFTYTSATGTNWSCGLAGTTVTCDYSGGAITATNHAPPITLTGQIVKVSAGTITNGASVASTDGLTGDPNQGNDGPSQVIVTVTAGTNLRANKTMVSNATGQTTYVSGDAVTLTLSATNTGTQDATGVTITDSVPAGFTLGAMPGGCAAVGQDATCTVGALAHGATSSNFVIPLTVTGAAVSGTNTANVARTAPVGGNNTPASVNFTISPPFAHLTLTKSKSPTLVAALGFITSTITVTNSNASTSAATGTVTVVDTLNSYPNETYVSVAAPWACTDTTASDGNITCTYAIPVSLARGASLPNLVITTQAAAGFNGSVTNTGKTGQGISSHLPADTGGLSSAAAVVSGTDKYVNLSVAKTASKPSPAHILVADNSFTYTLVVSNANFLLDGTTPADTAPTVSVSDPLPSWYNGSGGTTGGSAVITGAGGGESCSFGSTVTCTLKNLARNSSRTITITLNRPVQDGTFVNTATVTTPDAIDTAGPKQSSATVIIDPIADASVTGIAAAPNPVKVGVQLTYTTSIKNNGPSTATGVVLRQRINLAGWLPNNRRMSYVAASAGIAGTTANCSFVTFAGAPYAGDEGIECTGFSLADGEARQLIFKVIPIYPYLDALPANFTSDANITTATPESDAGTGYANNSNSNTVSVITKDIDLAVTDNDPGYDPSSFGDSIIYQVKVQNNGPSQATGFKLTVTPAPPGSGVPDAYTMAWNSGGSTLPGGASCSQPGGAGTNVICYLAGTQGASILAANTNQTFNLKFDTGPISDTPTSTLTYKTTAMVESYETGVSPFAGDTLPANNSVAETTTVLPKTDLMVVSKTVTAGSPFSVNQPFTYTVVVGNLGPSPAVGVTVTDTLPTGLVLTGAATATAGAGFALTTNTCTSSGTPVTVTCTLGTLPVAASGADSNNLVTITIPVKAPYPSYTGPFSSNLTNTASIAPLPNTSRDPTPGNNSNSVNVQVVKSSIAGSVYSDNNRNDALDAGEKITASVTFGLYGVDNWGNNIGTVGAPISLSTSTGDFLFDNLPQSNGAGYAIVETQPAGYYDRFETAGTSGGTVPAATCDGAANCSSSAAHNTISAIVMATNTAATGYLFQEYKAATVSGYVYSDLNNDGLRAGGSEVGISGIQVKIAGTTYWTGGDVCAFLAGACTATTDGSGFYSFTAPPSAAGNSYTVAEQTQPATYYDGQEQNGAGAGNVIALSAGRAAPESITVGQVEPNGSYTERNFGELKQASIAGSVFIDTNSDAVKQGGETGGVPGVTITLAGSDYLGNAVCPSATVPSCTFATDASGNYSITGLPPSGAGGYSVTETPPAGMTHTGTQAGSIGGTISGVVRAANAGVTGVGVVSTSAIVLGAGINATGYNFGEAGQGVSGFVYADLNRNGTKDAGEPGIQGVTVTLSGLTVGGANVCAAIAPNPCSVTTASNGGYSFAGLPQSNGAGYTLTETQPAAYPDGAESLGAVVGAGGANGSISGPNPTYDQFSGIVLPIGGVGTNYNFGEWAGSLAGTVYLDVDNSGTNNAGDTPIAGVTVTLGGAAAATTTTDASGNFTFSGLAAGTYTLTETQPANYADRTNTAGSAAGTVGVNTITNIVLGGGVSATGYLFGEKTGAISGTVYLDANNNGVQDAGETTGIGSVLLTLTGTAADGTTVVSSTTNTLANGTYSFTGLLNANAAGYTITETQPGAYLDGLQRKGLVNGANCAACVITVANKISAIPFDASKTFTLFDFGELVATGISGSVYHDFNNNSTKDAGEALVGVTLTLTGNDDLGAPVNLSTTTAADGTYSFSGLRPSNGAGYTVTETQPAGISDYPAATGTQVGTINGVATGTAAQNAISAITLPSATAGLNYDFRETASSLAGTVYVDANNDGVPQAGETRLAGVTVTLSGTTGAAANVCTVIPSCVATTAADGTYSFIGLPSGTYTLTETQPAGYNDGMEGAGSPAGTVNNATFDATPASNRVANIPLGAAQSGTGYNFGEIQIPTVLSSLAGTVYVDANNDGVPQSNETRLAGVAVTLSGTTSAGVNACTVIPSCVATTAADGTYSFTGLPAGTYTLTETQPAGYNDGKEAAGMPAGTVNNATFDATAASNQVANIPLGASQNGTGYNFGEQIKGGTLSGFVYSDVNGNGVKDPGDPGIAGVSLTLTGTDVSGNPVNLATTTDGTGAYSFPNLSAAGAGGYTVAETQPDGWLEGQVAKGMIDGAACAACNNATLNRISAIPFDSLKAFTDFNFGEVKGSSISGKVYHDVNRNGTQDAGDPGLGGIAISLAGNDDLGATVNRTTTTAADGTYSFTGLRASGAAGYSVTETQPAGIKDFVVPDVTAGTAVGKINGVANGSAAQNQITGIALGVGQDGVRYDFREDASIFVGGSVYLDANDNGVREAGETGIPNIIVTLAATGGGACADGTVTCTATTDAGGYFTFAGLRAGTYTMTETHPVIYTDGKETAGSAGGTVDNTAYDATPAHNRISNIALAAGSQAGGYLFGELPGVRARLAGRVWINTDHNGTKDQFDPGDTPLPGWIVELVKDGVVLGSTTTGADGTYQVNAVTPDYNYSVRFKNPANGQIWAGPVVNGGDGTVSSDKTSIDSVVAPSNGDITGLDLPIDPSGVVYDAVTRAAVGGATVTISGPAGFDAAAHVIGGTASQVTGSDGLYQFLLTSAAPSGIYTLSVAPPPAYAPGVSTIIPPCSTVLNVLDLPNPAKVQATATAPAASTAAHVPASCPASTGISFLNGSTTTLYYLNFNISTKTPVSGNVIDNHIPVDPMILGGAIVMTKTTPLVNVTRGGLVPYTLTATNSLAAPMLNVDVLDQMPPGFKFRSGSARMNGVAAEPLVNGRTLTWRKLSFNASEKKTISLVLTVGSGVGEGEYVNQAWALNDLTATTISNVATASVRIVPDPTFDCSDIIGKVFDDRNANGYQDEGEPGIANVRLVTARGWLVTSDKDGRFHVACAAIPQADHGSNFIMKLDERTLPSGFRVTTENPRVVRLTRGRMVKLNFGATVHRVVRVEVGDAAFPGTELELNPEWQSRFAKLPDDIRDRPSVVRLAYRLDVASRELAERRLDALENGLRKRWEELACCYPLSIEREITGGAQ
jgi:uncharacterized repeat protein (TIGR01451 family)